MDNLYAGIDLHSNNSYLAIIDENDKPVFKKKLANNADLIISTLEIYREAIFGVVVESTFNWYWLVDALMAAGFTMHLVNFNALNLRQYRAGVTKVPPPIGNKSI